MWPREGTLAYDRQRLIDSIGTATQRAVGMYEKKKEAEEPALVKEALANLYLER